MQKRMLLSSLVALFLLASVCAFGANGDKAKVKGMIATRTGETLLVRSADGDTTIVLTDDTKTKDDTGVFGLSKKYYSNVVLIPGLKVKVDGTTDDQGRVVAKTITVDGDDLETAEMIQAGLHPTAQQVQTNVENIETNRQGVAANKAQLAAHKQDIETNRQNIEKNMQDIEEHTDRFEALTDYDVKGQATVKFGVGSSAVSAEDKEELKQLAQTAKGMKGYIIEVMGYTDSTGSAAVNTKLSKDRAEAVINCLVQEGKIPVRHIVAPGAMGEYEPTASNETKSGRAENRRVEVKVLLNKGLAGS